MMKHDLSRLRFLAGLNEDSYTLSQDEKDDQDVVALDAKDAREAKVTKLIEFAFRKLGLDIRDDGVYYDEDRDREAIVSLDDDEIDVAKLAGLMKTGLSETFTIQASDSILQVIFTVLPTVDRAIGF